MTLKSKMPGRTTQCHGDGLRRGINAVSAMDEGMFGSRASHWKPWAFISIKVQAFEDLTEKSGY